MWPVYKCNKIVMSNDQVRTIKCISNVCNDMIWRDWCSWSAMGTLAFHCFKNECWIAYCIYVTVWAAHVNCLALGLVTNMCNSTQCEIDGSYFKTWHDKVLISEYESWSVHLPLWHLHVNFIIVWDTLLIVQFMKCRAIDVTVWYYEVHVTCC